MLGSNWPECGAPADCRPERHLGFHFIYTVFTLMCVGEISRETAAETLSVLRKTADECSKAETGPHTAPASEKKITASLLTICSHVSPLL